MPNIVIASKDNLCQSAKNWFVKFKNCVETMALDNLGDNDTLYIIAHDAELGDADALINMIGKATANVPMTNFKVILIVCSAASLLFSKDLQTPAENLANFLKRNVLASENNVLGIWNDQGNASFKGKYVVVKPGDDLLSLFANMKVSSGAAVPKHAVSAAAAAAANSGAAAGSGAAAAPTPSANGNGAAAAAAATKGASIQNHYKPNAGGNAGGAGGAGGAAPSDN